MPLPQKYQYYSSYTTESTLPSESDISAIVLHPSRIGLDPTIRRRSIYCLNMTLAALSDLKSQIKQAHWAVRGKDYFQLHTMFDELSEELGSEVDKLAERITALGGTPKGTNKDSARNSILPEYPLDISAGEDHVRVLSDHYAKFGDHVRSHIKMAEQNGDLVTMDLYIKLTELSDKRLWFLESHIQ